MNSRREAENVVRKIRKSRRADDPGGAAADSNARSLSRALDMLSTQLYTKSTHFILELIQNADDNTYAPGVEPLLTLVYRSDGYLWIGCNEVGFSRANVEAICDINNSTKKVKDATKGYIGEKGIGFKAIFKVADVCWVSSGHYSFRFERDNVLGMIVPIWCEFHSTRLMSERTMFCLRIPNVSDQKTVKENLLGLRTELLLFLRKLRRIDVRIYDSEATKPSFGFALTRKQPPEPQPQTIVTLSRKDLVGLMAEQSEELFISKMTLEDMPIEAKREGIRATEVVLAFPLSASADTVKARPVYNFLPIRTFGFNADFILTSNREDITRDNSWNRSLLEGALDLFASTVRQFNRTGICKYRWPSFTKCNDAGHGTILEGFIPRLRKLLQGESILESQAGYLSRPSELMLVPDHFTDGLDPPRPLFDDVLNTFKYASFAYPTQDLESMGVVHQTPEQVCALLKWMTPAQLEQKSSTWHSRLAAGIAQSDPSAFSSAKLIPLRNGEWISAADEPIYFPNMDDNVQIPGGIEVKIISKAACADPARKHMFALFGAKLLTGHQICNQILDRHRFLSISNNNLSVSCLVSHAWYLFSHGSLALNYGAFRLANELGQAVSGEELYMQLPDSRFQMREYLPASLFAADFVHPDYLTQGETAKRPAWYKWLADTLHVSLLPNLLTGRKGPITREFQHLIDNHRSQVWLTLIRDNWQHYAMDPGLLSNRVASIPVQCTNQEVCQLKDAYIATSAIMQEPLAERYIHLIDVPDPRNSGWLNLTGLGLRTTPDLDFYLMILRGVARTPPSDVERDIVIHLYQNVERLSRGDPKRVKTAFTIERLILPSSCTPSSTWRDLSECRWDSPACLTRVESLSLSFPTCRDLFVTTLDIENANAADVIEELCSQHEYSPDHSQMPRARVKELLFTLSMYPLSASDLDEPLQRLSRMQLIPVRMSGEFEYRAAADAEWFIPDRLRYVNSFKGNLWFLDFEKEQFGSLRKLFERMGVADRELSRHVKVETVTEGKSTSLPLITKELQEKARYVALLGPDLANRSRTLSCISHIQAYSSDNLIIRRYVTVNGKRIHGADDKGRTVLEHTDTFARLHISTDSIANGVLPWYFVCESLMSWLELPEERSALLNSILHARDHELIEDMLERAGLFEGEVGVSRDEADTESNGCAHDRCEEAIKPTDQTRRDNVARCGAVSADTRSSRRHTTGSRFDRSVAIAKW